MRHVTPLRTMRRLWCDASAAVRVDLAWNAEVNRESAKRRERRKECSAGAPTRGEEARAARGLSKFQARGLASAEHRPSAARRGASEILKMKPDECKLANLNL